MNEDEKVRKIRRIISVVFGILAFLMVTCVILCFIFPIENYSVLNPEGDGMFFMKVISVLTTLISTIIGLGIPIAVLFVIIKTIKAKGNNELGIRIRRPEMMDHDDTIFKDAAYKDENGHIRINLDALVKRDEIKDPEKEQQEYLRNDYHDSNYSYYNDDSRYNSDGYNLNGEYQKKDKKNKKDY